MTSAGSAADPQTVCSGVSPRRSAVVAEVVPLLPAWRLDRAFDYSVPSELEVEVGSLVRVPFGARNVRAVVTGLAERVPEMELQPIAKVLLDRPVVEPPLDELARWVANRYAVPLGKSLDRFVPPRVRIATRATRPIEGGPQPELLLTYDGGRALADAVEKGTAGTWCLNALPSHDRAALIAELLAAAGRGGGSALVAVPEVRFGSKVIEGLQKIWPDLARVDSAQEDKDRAASWLQLARGHGLGCGGRSTVFAPSPALRLIVLDEEHSQTFKEDRSPRYDARRVAIERARLQGAVCVLVSDVPTVESAGAAARSQFGWVEPTREARRAARPLVETVEPPKDGEIAEQVFRRIREALREEVDVAILVPRRGYARVVWCAACRRSLRCPRCEAALVFDRAHGEHVRCPRCNLTAPPPGACPSCGANDFRYLGAGSERLTEQLGKAFPRADVRRMDPEALGADGPTMGPTDIYVTTWIGTKPEIRPQARFVAVLDGDGLLRRPDFRAAELGFQALGEMARWAGPAAEGGRLMVQTSEPNHPAIQAVVRGDPRFFLERELELRRELLYPPFGELVKLTGPEEAVRKAADEAGGLGARVLGPIALPRSEEHEALVKTPDAGALLGALRPLLAGAKEGANVRVDTDPA